MIKITFIDHLIYDFLWSFDIDTFHWSFEKENFHWSIEKHNFHGSFQRCVVGSFHISTDPGSFNDTYILGIVFSHPFHRSDLIRIKLFTGLCQMYISLRDLFTAMVFQGSYWSYLLKVFLVVISYRDLFSHILNNNLYNLKFNNNLW